LDVQAIILKILESLPVGALMVMALQYYFRKTQKQEEIHREEKRAQDGELKELERVKAERMDKIENAIIEIKYSLAAMRIPEIMLELDEIKTNQRAFESDLKDLWRINQKKILDRNLS
jgi:hypothetical protein